MKKFTKGSDMKKLILLILLVLFINHSYAKEQVMENQNDVFNDFATQLMQDDKNPTFNREFLKPKQLDYSLESLNFINEFLIDADKKELHLMPYEDVVRLALRTGAYVGETVRKNDKNIEWNWVEYDEAIKLHPEIGQYQEKSLGTRFLLIGTSKKDTFVHFSFPINKVLKNLENGDEDSVYAFALTQVKLQDEMQNLEIDANNLN